MCVHIWSRNKAAGELNFQYIPTYKDSCCPFSYLLSKALQYTWTEMIHIIALPHRSYITLDCWQGATHPTNNMHANWLYMPGRKHVPKASQSFYLVSMKFKCPVIVTASFLATMYSFCGKQHQLLAFKRKTIPWCRTGVAIQNVLQMKTEIQHGGIR